MKISTVRGILLLAGIALVVAKLAGIIDWPWLAVAVPLLAWGYPWIAGLAGILGHIALGLIVLVVVVIMGFFADLELRAALRQRRKDIADGREIAGAWDL